MVMRPKHLKLIYASNIEQLVIGSCYSRIEMPGTH